MRGKLSSIVPDELADETAESDDPTERDDAPSRARRRWLRVGVFGAFVGVAAALVVPKVPRAQEVRLHLGPGSTRVVQATARITHEPGSSWDRETRWRFTNGAPPSVQWAFELPNGDSEIEVELASSTSNVTRRVRLHLGGGETNVELAEAMRGLE
jgi:hypothetical protein